MAKATRGNRASQSEHLHHYVIATAAFRMIPHLEASISVPP